MKIVVLSDNHTMDDLLESGHGLSVYLETARCKCLLDAGNGIESDYLHTQFITGHCTGEKVYERLRHQLGEQITSFYTGYATTIEQSKL